jgi:hypothetical protein
MSSRREEYHHEIPTGRQSASVTAGHDQILGVIGESVPRLATLIVLVVG